ncbi:MAG: serine/threonine protein kinase [Anaerovibrio sp.]|uniref:serine/threonine protein kinase n=1 Tax=Anaerovibrio sp. TaxID=1872532 RepID=UPI001B18F94B|nr:serine/threonine-protein kinase [Anaerovibrio sp.]MBO6247172.1 serine/threonine protein kinase [Anaerovibrio sp.]
MAAIDFIDESFVVERELSRNEHGIVMLVKRIADDKLFIRREYREDKRDLFYKLKELDIQGIPHILYVIFAGRTVVIEEYIEGISLENVAQGNATLPNFTITGLLKDILPVIQQFHEASIIHRDIKPEHIILDKNFKPYLIDFGIARINKKHNTHDTEIQGTRRFAPPEQFGYQSTDQRSDIYSLGQTLATLLPIMAMTPHEKKIIEKAMAFDPTDRYQSAEAMLNALLNPPQKVSWYALVGIILLIIGAGGAWYHHTLIQEQDNKGVIEEINIDGEGPAPLPEGGENNREKTSEQGGITMPSKTETREKNVDIQTVPTDNRPLHIAQGSSRQKTVNINGSNVTVAATNTGTQLNVQLSDSNGHTASHYFTYQPPAIHNYDNPNTMDGDIIFMDINGDGILDIIPIMTSALVKGGNDLVDNTNAWAITYNPTSGFYRCSGMADTQYLKLGDGYLIDGDMMVYTVRNNTFTASPF